MTAVTIKPTQKSAHGVVWDGHPLLHEELSWWATADDRVLGAVIRDKIDRDYSYVILTRGPGEVFRAVDFAVSMPSPEVAVESLHAAMRAQDPCEYSR
jgi:hypothetical protein